jgi:hypothetical protein
LLGFLTRFLAEGIESGGFAPVPLEATAYLILSVINGIVRYSRINRDMKKNLGEAAVSFHSQLDDLTPKKLGIHYSLEHPGIKLPTGVLLTW